MAAAMVTPPTGTSLQCLAEQSWDRLGDGPVLYYQDERWTGLELAERTRRVAAGLREAGLGPGERVVVCMANCPEVTITYAAVWRAGAVATPVLFLLSQDELRYVLSDSGAALVVTTPEFLPKVRAAAAGADSVRGIVVAGEAAGDHGAPAGAPLLPFAELETAPPGRLVETHPAQLAALLYTGGTTGRPKGVMISHNALSAAAWAATATSYDEALGSVLVPLPLSHANGLVASVMDLHAPGRRTLVLMRWFDPVEWLQLAHQHRVNASPLVPSMLRMLLRHPLEDYDLSALVRLTTGSAPLPAKVTEELRIRLPHVEVGEGYGCTETATVISAAPLGQVRAGSVGRPVPGVEVRIERRRGSSAAPGEEGEICVRGSVLMSGYWKAEEETARALRGGWLHTGDVGRLDADGYLYIVDRIKDVIVRSGRTVYPSDVEDVLTRHPDVLAAAVVGRPDRACGEEVVAFVQLREDAAVSQADLVEFGQRHLPAAKYPREVRLVDAIPLTTAMTTDRKLLRAMLAQAEARGGDA